MQESDTTSPVAGENTTPASSTPANGSPVNRRHSRIFATRPVTNGNGAAKEQAAPAQVLDEGLEEDDVRIVISVDVHGRKLPFAKLQMDRTVFGGLLPQNRGMFFLALENVLKEIQQAVAIKVNTKLATGRKPDPENGSANGDNRGDEHLQSDSPARTPSANGGKRPLITTPLPPYVETDDEELRESLRIHVPPPLDAS